MNEDIFRSERLIYRAVEASDDETLFRPMIWDRVGYLNSNYNSIHLAGNEDATGYRKFCAEKCLLGAVICVPRPDSSLTKPTNSEAGTNTNPHDTHIPIGEIHLKALAQDHQHHRASEIGLQLLQKYQRHGYGTEAIKWILKYAFRYAGLHRVGIKAFEWNADALKLYEKCGFTVEGREREAAWHDGRFWDVVTMGLLEHEWRAMQDK